MNINLFTFPSPTPSYYKEGQKEYEKRLSRYCKIKQTDCKNKKQAEKVIRQIIERSPLSGETLFLVSAGEEISDLDSPGLASMIEQAGVSGVSALTFLIGFPTEAWEELKKNELISYQTLSVSRFSLSPALLTLVLTEQIYRAYRIIHKEPYHK